MSIRTLLTLAAAVSVPLAPALAADPVTQTPLASFGAPTAGNTPRSGAPTLGKDGNLYGTTQRGGGPCFCGAVYQLTPAGVLTQIYAFQGNGDGAEPFWALARDGAGNFYGMANADFSGTNKGTVFKVTPAGVFTVLFRFPVDRSLGEVMDNTVVIGHDGLLYGVAFDGGGATPGCGSVGCGVLFRLKTDGTGFRILYHFPGTPATPGYSFDYPIGGLAVGADGSLYGLSLDGANQYGLQSLGSLYRYDPSTKAVTQLHQFTTFAMDTPTGMPSIDAAQNLYFTGGPHNSTTTGSLYKWDASTGTLVTLHTFVPSEGTPGGENPPPLVGKDGRLYGVTMRGGAADDGTVFSLATDGSGFATLHDFTDVTPDGEFPGGLVAAADGSLWGTTNSGGTYASGIAYKLAKPTTKLTARPSTIALGGSSKLTWSSTDTTTCAPSGAWGPGALATSGTQNVKPAAAGTYTYTLTCSGAGSATKTATLTVQ